jgi:hypothetical protein
MQKSSIAMTALAVLILALAGCSRQQSDWQKTRQTNTAEAYEQFLKRYPNGDFTVQAQARLKDLYTERDWQKARDADTPDAYQAFVTQHPEGKYADEARNRIENFNLAQTPGTGEATAGGPSENRGAASPPEAGAGAMPGATATEAGAPGTASSGASGKGSPKPSVSKPSAPASPPASASASPSSSATGNGVAPSAHAHHLAHAPATGSAERSGSTHGKRYGVQLGAFRSGGSAAAHHHWAVLKKEYPELLKGLSPKVVVTKTTTGPLYRLQAVGVSESSARQICKSLRARSQACVVLKGTRT